MVAAVSERKEGIVTDVLVNPDWALVTGDKAKILGEEIDKARKNAAVYIDDKDNTLVMK